MKKSVISRLAFACLTILLPALMLSAKEQYLLITEEGQYEREIDVTGWQPGENFVYFFTDEGSYQPYLWQGEDSLDYRSDEKGLWIGDRMVGVNLEYAEEVSDPLSIVTVSVPPYKIENLERFPNAAAVTVVGYLEEESFDIGDICELSNLRGLYFNAGGGITAEQIKAISSCAGLRELDFGACILPENSMRELKKLTKLRGLSLASVPDEEMFDLAGLPNLRHVSRMWAVLDTEWVDFLPTLPSLIELTVIQAEIADPILEYLARTNQLRELNLPYAGIYGDKITYIGRMTNLRTLDLCGTEVEDSQVVHLSNLTNLRRLDLRTIYLTDEGLKHLRPLTNLQELILCSEEITDEGMKHLQPLVNLRWLNLTSCGITDQGLMHLRNLSNLRYVDVTDTKVSGEGIAKLAKSLPGCRVVKRY